MENSTPLVSIIIPIYNVEKYLSECLDSCLKQSYPNIEVVVVNDGSKDSSGDIAQSYATSDNRVRYFYHDNHGVSFTRGVGIDESIGEYIMFVDGDDFIDVNFVEKMMSVILRDHSDMVFCEAYRWYDETKKEEFFVNPKQLEIRSGIDYLEADLTTYMWGKIYRKELVVNLIPHNGNLFEDMFFNLQMLPRCKKLSYLRDFLYYYRFNVSSLINTSNVSDVILHAYELESNIDNFNVTGKIKDTIRRRSFSHIKNYILCGRYDRREINKLVNLMFRDYTYYFKTYKNLKLGLLLVVSKFYPELIKKI